MSAKLIELRPNRDLLNSNFDGYKLSLEPTAILKTELIKKPAKAQKSDEQISYLHAQLFAMQNHLIKDLWNSESFYFIDSELDIQKIHFNETDGKIKPIEIVYKILGDQKIKIGNYNLSLKFCSENYALASDGAGNLMFIETGERRESSMWKLKHSEIPLNNEKFVIIDAKMNIINQISVLLLHINHEENSFYSIIDYITYSLIDNRIEKSSHRTLKGKGLISYASIEPNNNAILISSNASFIFVYDDKIPISNEQVNTIFPFLWNQTEDEIYLIFKEKYEFETNNYKINFNEKNIHVSYNNKDLINVELFGYVEKDSISKAWEVSIFLCI